MLLRTLTTQLPRCGVLIGGVQPMEIESWFTRFFAHGCMMLRNLQRSPRYLHDKVEAPTFPASATVIVVLVYKQTDGLQQVTSQPLRPSLRTFAQAGRGTHAYATSDKPSIS